MFTISLHQIKIFAPIGLYPQEQLLGNHFEIDIEVDVKDYSEKHFVDYTLLQDCVESAFKTKDQILELLALAIYKNINHRFDFITRTKVCIRKMNPPTKGQIAFSQVIFEKSK
jgi:dihydroneopterin aldolase